MLIALIVAVGAVGVGLLRGGSLESLGSTTMRASWLLAAGLALQLGFDAWSPPWLVGARALLVVVVSNLAIIVFLALNARLPGMLIAEIGLALNLLVIVANGAMPVSSTAAQVAGLPPVPDAAGLKHERMDEGTVLPWLGDIIPLPGLRNVISTGDLVLAWGIARFVYQRVTAAEPLARSPRRASG